MTNSNISALILVNISNGLSLEAAMDAVLGAGTFANLASDLYDSLQATA